MKRFCALLVLLALALTMFSVSFAENENDTVTVGATESEALTETGPGGLDFYSITVHYESPILVDYMYESKTYKFVNSDGESTLADKYVYRTGTTKALAYYGIEKSSKSATDNFYQLASTNDVIIPAEAHYSKIPYNYAYITHIQDGAVLKTKNTIAFYGITDPYDDGEPYVNHNPNVNYDSNGYALDQNTDEDGNQYRIDINSYRITKDYLWLDSDGRRIELFYQKAVYICTGPNEKGVVKYDSANVKYLDEYVLVPYSMRFDENGKVRKVSDICFYQYVTTEEMTSFLDTYGETATPANPAILEFHVADPADTDLIQSITKTNKKNYKTTQLPSYCRLFRVSKDIPASELTAEQAAATDAAPAKYEDAYYYDVNTNFTMDNIYRDADGNLVFGTPVMGTPQLNVKIKNITIEIDAVGSQTYDNEADDPQYLNTIVITLNDYEKNIARKQAALEGNFINQATYDNFHCSVLATVHSKTTSTAVNFDGDSCTDNYKPTVASIDLGLTEEQIAALPKTATIYFNFHIKTHQPEEAFDLSKCKLTSKKSSLTTENAILYKAPTATLVPEKTEPEGGSVNWGLIGGIAGGVVVVAAAVIAIIAGTKKKKNKAE